MLDDLSDGKSCTSLVVQLWNEYLLMFQGLSKEGGNGKYIGQGKSDQGLNEHF
jgi:hypothetical protein